MRQPLLSPRRLKVGATIGVFTPSSPAYKINPGLFENGLRTLERIDWTNDDWKNKSREWQENSGWNVLQAGAAEAPILATNLNTMISAAGTGYWPDFKGKILLIEEMDAPLMKEERSFRQLSLIGVFDEIAGLIVSKPEVYSSGGAMFGYDDLIKDIVGKRDYPIVSDFDCGHTIPMITVPQGVRVRLEATESKVSFEFLEPAFSRDD